MSQDGQSRQVRLAGAVAGMGSGMVLFLSRCHHIEGFFRSNQSRNLPGLIA